MNIPTKFYTTPIAIASLALAATFVTTHASAQSFFLEGEKGIQGDQGPQGDPELSCVSGNCTLNQDLVVTGIGTFNDVDVNELTVNTTYWLPDCPDGYTRDGTVTGYVLCKKGLDEVVKVGDFWIDRYEASMWSNSDCMGTQYGETSDDYPAGFPDNGNWTTEVYACSLTGEEPAAAITWFQAQQACVLSGKELCTNAQWQAAAQGTPDPGAWPDTSGPPSGTCTASVQSGQCNTCSTGVRNTGQASSCSSNWGAEDMIGNLWEWITMWQGHPGWNGEENYMTSEYGNDAYWAGGEQYIAHPNQGTDNSWRTYSSAFGGDGDAVGDYYGPAAARRGGRWYSGSQAGVFALTLWVGPSAPANMTYGFRCCIGR